MKQPAPPIIRMLAAKADAERRIGQLITAEEYLHAWITANRARGNDFATWTPEGDKEFRLRRWRARADAYFALGSA